MAVYSGKAVERFSGVDVLVNNAGMGMLARFEDVTDLSLYERLMRVNYLGSLVMSFKGRLGRWAKLIAPGLVDRMAAEAVRKGK